MQDFLAVGGLRRRGRSGGLWPGAGVRRGPSRLRTRNLLRDIERLVPVSVFLASVRRRAPEILRIRIRRT